MKFNKLATLALMAGIMVLSQACGKKKGDSSKVSGANSVTRSGQPSNLPNQVYTNQAVFVQGSDLERMTKVFLSPMIDPQYIGTISSQNGVSISGYIEVNQANGQGIVGNSGINIVVRDSLVGQVDQGTGQINEPIDITMNLTQGHASAGQVDLVFQDEQGTLRINGQYNQSTFQGTISFRNNGVQPWTPNGLREGTLGTFQIPTSSFFQGR